jgi:hypothetical protein
MEGEGSSAEARGREATWRAVRAAWEEPFKIELESIVARGISGRFFHQ